MTLGWDGRLRTITVAARLFALVVLGPPVAFSQNYSTILATMLLAATWMGATLAMSLPGYQPTARPRGGGRHWWLSSSR